MKILLAALLCATPAFAADSGWESTSRLPQLLAQPLPGDALQTTVHRLSNGITVYLSPNHQTPRVTSWIGVRAGAAHDPSDSTGMAHYLEHMLFKGSRRLGTLDYEKEKVSLERIQALYETLFGETDPEKRKAVYAAIDKENQAVTQYAVPGELDKVYKSFGFTGMNAHTANEQTVYKVEFPKNRLNAWAKVEADRFEHPVFRLFQSEIETVYEELNMRLDGPFELVWTSFYRELFKGHPYAVPLIGTVEHLKNPSLAKMYAFYDRHYLPNNMAIALAGDFEREQALALLEAEFGRLKPKPLAPRANPPIAALAAPVRVDVKFEGEELALIGWPTVPVNHPDEDALAVMGMVASNGEAGLVDLRLNQAQTVKGAVVFQEFLTEAGIFVGYVLPKDGQTIEQAQALLLETLEALKKGDFSEEDLKAIVLNYEISEKYKRESNDARVQAMIDSFTEYDEWARRSSKLARLRTVTKDDVVRVAGKYLGPNRVEVYRRKGKPEIPKMTKPDFTKVDLAPGRQSAFAGEISAMPATPIEPRWVVKDVDYVERKAPFGKVVAAKNPMNDLFSLSYQVERGARHDRLACMAATLWEKAGAGDLSADALKKRLYSLGVSMSAWCAERSSGWSLSGPETNLEEGLRLLRARFRSPNIEPGTLEKLVAIEIGQHKDNKLEMGVIKNALVQWSERGTQSPVLLEFSDAELKALKESELKAKMADFLAWKGRASYVGSRGTDEVAAVLTEKGAALKPAPAKPAVSYVKPKAPRVVFTHRDMTQSQVRLHAADGTLEPTRMLDYNFYSNYMGGGFSSVIFQEIREARSLAYSAWGGYGSGALLGDENRLLGVLGCQTDKTVEAVELMLKLFADPPYAEVRLKESRDSILQSYRTDPLTFREIPGAVQGWEDIGFKSDPRPERFKRAQGYSLDEFKAFAGRMKGKVMTVTVLGNRDRLDMKALAKFGELVEKKVDDLFPY
ncbi:MAG: peptidase M16 domain-containing protein [Elusimicrobia bacterium]|nr:MAG: peptidase M16 domain-containing protein [Elusimicrobiota bacterium]